MEGNTRDKMYSQIRFITAHNDMLDETSSNAIFCLIKKEVPGAILTVYSSSTDYDILLDRVAEENPGIITQIYNIIQEKITMLSQPILS